VQDLAFPVVAAAFALVHLLSPLAARRIANIRGMASFSGGMAVAYVFLHLVPELDEGHELVGERIYFVALLGFTLLYGVRHRLSRRPDARSAHYAVHTAIGAVYTGLLVFTLGNQLPETVPLTIVFVLSIGMHLLGGDIGSLEDFGDRFRNQSRYVLAAAAAFGYVLSLVREPHEMAVDVLTAILAGFMLFTIFREELPDIGKARFRAFLLGLIAFAVLHVVLARGSAGEPAESTGRRVEDVRPALALRFADPPGQPRLCALQPAMEARGSAAELLQAPQQPMARRRE